VRRGLVTMVMQVEGRWVRGVLYAEIGEHELVAGC
jgi:hypothetical protein